MEAAPIIRPKMPELDTIRGIAILSVLFYYGFFWSKGVTGLFFRHFVHCCLCQR